MYSSNLEVNNNTKTGSYETANQIKFKTAMPKSSLCDYSDTYILVKRITGVETGVIAMQVDQRGEKVIFKNFAPSRECISKINNTQKDNAKILILWCQCII